MHNGASGANECPELANFVPSLDGRSASLTGHCQSGQVYASTIQACLRTSRVSYFPTTEYANSTLPTLTLALSKTALRVRPRVHGRAQTWSDARCPSGGGVNRSYAPDVDGWCRMIPVLGEAR